jgi:medium-chain acyl-[acyl-carrier-protein] hydrolase
VKPSWIVKPRPRPEARLKLICLPFAGGGSSSFRTWAPLLPPQIELLTIEIPGRGQRLSKPLRTRIESLVPDIANALTNELDRPFALFGHSMGTLLGFELAHYLRSQFKKEPVYLFFSGRGAPGLPSTEEPIHQLPKDDFIRRIREYNGTPKEVLEHQELMDLMVPILRADFEVCETYTYNERAPFNCPLTAFGGLQDSGAPKAHMQAWEKPTTGRFNLRMFPGGHFFILEHTQILIQSLLRDINEYLTLSVF